MTKVITFLGNLARHAFRTNRQKENLVNVAFQA